MQGNADGLGLWGSSTGTPVAGETGGGGVMSPDVAQAWGLGLSFRAVGLASGSCPQV